MKITSIEFGPMGHVGAYISPHNNAIAKKINTLIDQYNSKINTFHTDKKQMDYHIKIKNKISKLHTKIHY